MADLFITGRRYHYTLLNAAEKEIYKGIYNGFRQRRPKFVIIMPPINGQYPSNPHLNRILSAVIQDNPAMYYVDFGSITMYRDVYRPEKLTMTYTEFFTPAQSEQIDQALRYRVDAILNMLQDHAAGYPQVFQLYRYLAEQVHPCDSGASNTLSQLESHSIIGPLLNRGAVCAGYAKTFQLICQQLDIGCLHIIGDASPSKTNIKWSPHSWNVVYVEGRFYHADPMFDSTFTQSRRRLSCDYFLRSDTSMLADHRWNRGDYPAMTDNYL